MTDAAVGAVNDAGLSLHDVDGVYVAHSWEEPSLMEAVLFAERLGIEPARCDTVSLGGASPCGMVVRAAEAIESGSCEVVLLAAGSNRASGLGREAAITALRDVADPSAEIPFGAYIPPLYALVAQRYMHAYGTTQEQLASVAVAQRRNASLRPLATKRSLIGVEDVLSSPMIASPLHLLDCCLVTDFGTALVMTTAERARDLRTEPVRVLGWGESHGPLSLTRTKGLEMPLAAQRSGQQALSRSQLSPAEIESAQLYDSFTITVLVTLEALGLCKPGEAGPFVEDGGTSADGQLPVNTNGGMLSYATGGMFHITEAVATLRGERADLMSRRPSNALVHGIGGILSSHISLVLGRA